MQIMVENYGYVRVSSYMTDCADIISLSEEGSNYKRTDSVKSLSLSRPDCFQHFFLKSGRKRVWRTVIETSDTRIEIPDFFMASHVTENDGDDE